MVGHYHEALSVLKNRIFHPWEGGEGKVPSQYTVCLVEIAKSLINTGQYSEAVNYLTQAKSYPENLGEGKLYGTQENHIDYYLGVAYSRLGNHEQATNYFTKASTGLSEPTSPLYYNDQPPDMIFYQGLANRKLHNPEKAQNIFNELIDYGQEHLGDNIQMDYFAVSLPDFLVFEDDLNTRNDQHCRYMMALGYLGLGKEIQAVEHFQKILIQNPAHQGAVTHNKIINEANNL